MIPVFQRRSGVGGDCIAAALASIFEVELEEALDPYCFGPNPTITELDAINIWLAPRGIFLTWVRPGSLWLVGETWHLMSGKSPRGLFNHVVVACGGQMKHDPHPSGEGLENVTHWGIFVVSEPWIRR